MSHPNGPYSEKEVAHLTPKQKKKLREQARHYVLNSKEIIKIIIAQPKLREKIVKNKKVRDAVKKKLHPTYSRSAPKGPQHG